MYIHPTAVVYPNAIIEEGVYIGAYCIVGSAPEYANRSPFDPHGGVLIKRGTILHGLVTIDAATNEGDLTIIGEDCTLMKGSHVGHDCVLDNNVTLSCGAKIGGYSKIRGYTTVGLNASVHQLSTVPFGTMIGANAFFKKFDDFKSAEFKIWAGVPSKVIGDNWRLKQKLYGK